MALFSNFFNGNDSNLEDLEGFNDDVLAGHYKELSYEECNLIWRYFHLGKRIATALPNFAMSAPREIIIDDSPDEVVERFKKTCIDFEIDKKIKQAVVVARVYGMSGIYLANNEPYNEPLKDIGSVNINIIDSLALSGTQIIQDPLSPYFNQPKSVYVNGKNVDFSRVLIITNDINQYLKFTSSSLSYSPPSIYQNMASLIPIINRSVVALDRLATKAGGIILKTKQTAIGSGLIASVYKRIAQIFKKMQNDGVAVVDKDSDVELFNLSGATEISNLKNALNSDLLMALSDTPSAILLDKNLAQGFADGTEDMKAILMSVNNFREIYLKKAYDFLDDFIMKVAWDNAFIDKIKAEYADLYNGFDNLEIFNLWKQNFRFEWGNLYPNTENEELDIKLKKIQAISAVYDMGADRDEVENELNIQKIFSDTINLTNDRVISNGYEQELSNTREPKE